MSDDTFIWNGRMEYEGPKQGQNKGVMKQRKAEKREQAEARNVGGSTRQGCGHNHGPMQVSRCDIQKQVKRTRTRSAR